MAGMIWYIHVYCVPHHCRYARCQVFRFTCVRSSDLRSDTKKTVKHIPEPRLSKGFHTVIHKAREFFTKQQTIFLFFDLDRYIRHHLPLSFAVVSHSNFYL